MKRALVPLSARAFSLIEVIITIGVIAFAFVGLLGMFPLALQQSRACVDETRGAQLARMVFSTLTSESLTKAPCFAESGADPLDLSSFTEASEPVVLYASYDVRNQAKIVRSTNVPATAEYRLELRFQPAPSLAGTALRGTRVQLRIANQPARKDTVFEGTQFVCKSSRAVFAK